ncbi:hypothetical protein [Nonomuraea insulae]|uniref:Thioredoxin domain-containing protein n=1 Tax=Nonomuraea insulae TaxID=1616787 RepID=A0ABW1CFZ0_9ACTN
MTILFSLALVLLTAAVALLFAMMGELASRVPAPAPATRPVNGVLMGATAHEWPSGLAPTDERPMLLVLSTACASCEALATGLAAHQVRDSVGVVVSTGSTESGEDFVARHSLGGLPHFIDPGGKWVAGNFGVRISPAALRFVDGRLSEAYTFSDLAALSSEEVHDHA